MVIGSFLKDCLHRLAVIGRECATTRGLEPSDLLLSRHSNWFTDYLRSPEQVARVSMIGFCAELVMKERLRTEETAIIVLLERL